jgi:hypothetical protein
MVDNSTKFGKNRGLTYFGENGEFMPIRNDLKRTDESIVPTKPIIDWSVSSRNEIININDKERFAHKWEKRIQKLIRANM